jgi:hypothetical protein
VAVLQEATAEVPADKPGPAGDANVHSKSGILVGSSRSGSRVLQKRYRSSEYTHS